MVLLLLKFPPSTPKDLIRISNLGVSFDLFLHLKQQHSRCGNETGFPSHRDTMMGMTRFTSACQTGVKGTKVDEWLLNKIQSSLISTPTSALNARDQTRILGNHCPMLSCLNTEDLWHVRDPSAGGTSVDATSLALMQGH